MAGELVFVHGFHLFATNWHEVIWGDPTTEGLWGRVPRGIEVATETLDPTTTHVVIGSGGSERDGEKEAHITNRVLHEKLEALPLRLRQYTKALIASGRLHVQDSATRTTEEIQLAYDLCLKHSLTKLTLISSPTHISRCLRDGEIIKATRGDVGHIRLCATASDTNYAGYEPADVAIVEPPHRGDFPGVPLQLNALRIMPFYGNAEVGNGFNRAWAALIDEWLPKLKR